MARVEHDDANWLKPVKCSGNAIEDGYVKCEVEPGSYHSAHETAERMAKVAPYDPQPVAGGFVPLNNVFDRI